MHCSPKIAHSCTDCLYRRRVDFFAFPSPHILVFTFLDNRNAFVTKSAHARAHAFAEHIKTPDKYPKCALLARRVQRPCLPSLSGGQSAFEPRVLFVVNRTKCVSARRRHRHRVLQLPRRKSMITSSSALESAVSPQPRCSPTTEIQFWCSNRTTKPAAPRTGSPDA